MTIDLPKPLAAYFAAKNRKDIEGMLQPFAEDARVRDEGEDMEGHAAIREWMEKTTRKYGVTVEISGVSAESGTVLVTASVSGNFPGSPATLHYRFVLRADAITRLEIGA
jgi:ketosteroid isomerase-like protein